MTFRQQLGFLLACILATWMALWAYFKVYRASYFPGRYEDAFTIAFVVALATAVSLGSFLVFHLYRWWTRIRKSNAMQKVSAGREPPPPT